MFCLSKGLGAPAGSLLLGPRDFIENAHIGRKLLGGGMRQIGILAAAGLIALEETPKILHRDHENARFLANGLSKIKGVAIDPKKVATNIVIFDVRASGRTADDICSDLGKHRILCGSSDKYAIRMVTHYDVDRAGIDRALAATSEVITGRAPAAAAH
jgi:threonine aldolase